MKKQGTQPTTGSKNKSSKKAYTSPGLKQYGAIHMTTQASGGANGDAGMGMMA